MYGIMYTYFMVGLNFSILNLGKYTSPMDHLTKVTMQLLHFSPFALYQIYCRAPNRPSIQALLRSFRTSLEIPQRDSGLGVGLEGVQTLGSLENFLSFGCPWKGS